MHIFNILTVLGVCLLAAASGNTPYPAELLQGLTAEQLAFLEESYRNYSSIVGSQLTLTYNVTFDSNNEPILDHTSTALKEVVTISFNGRICETSSASPLTPHVYQALQDLFEVFRKDIDHLCCQSNWWGSHCTRMKDHKTASLGICGTRGACLKCQEVFWLLTEVANDCQWEGKVGGMWRIGGWIDMIIYHS